MQDTSLKNLFICFGIGVISIVFVYSIVALFDTSSEDLEKADASYRLGESAQTIAERKEAFNQTLSLYLKLEDKHAPVFGNGKLYYNLGNTYFQLGELPLAIWNYSKAHSLMPRNKKVMQNLQLARQKLHLPEPTSPSFFQKLLNYFSLPERLQITCLLLMVLFFVISAAIWLQHSWLYSVAIPITFAFFLSLMSLFYTQFLDPAKAIILKGSFLYRDPGKHYAKVIEEPLTPGSTVEVLQIVHGGRWIKIITTEEALGFVPAESLKIY